MKTVSVIIPVYNEEDGLERCVSSVRGQTYEALEILLLDDGSADRSGQVCQALAEKDSRISFLHHENHGVSYTRNRGIAHAEGQYIIFADSDDEMLPDMIEKYVSAAKETEADIVTGGIDIVTEGRTERIIPKGRGQIRKKDFWKLAAAETTGLFGYTPNKLYRTSFLKENHLLFREDMQAQEDLEFALRAYGHAGRIALLPYSGYRYYHRKGHRSVPPRDLLGNQITLYTQAERAGTGADVLDKLRERIGNMTYGCLFQAENGAEIKALTELDRLLRILDPALLGNMEQRMILTWFVRGRTERITAYFKVRKIIKRIWKKEK